jgi:hypothetical protein
METLKYQAEVKSVMADCISSHEKKWVRKVDAVLVFVLLAFGACAGCIHQEERIEPAPFLEDYFRGDFTVIGEPILNQEVEIIFTVKPITDSLETRIQIHLPEGIELIQGDLSWEGNLKEDEVVEIKVTVKPIREGQWEIWSYVEGLLDGIADKSLTYYLYLLTSRDNGQVSRTPFYSEYSVEGTAKEMIAGLSLKSVPRPNAGEEVVLTFAVMASKDMPNVKAVIILPEEFILLNGPLEWSGNLEKEKEETFQITIKTTERGRFKILGILTYDDEEYRFAYYIFVH